MRRWGLVTATHAPTTGTRPDSVAVRQCRGCVAVTATLTQTQMAQPPTPGLQACTAWLRPDCCRQEPCSCTSKRSKGRRKQCEDGTPAQGTYRARACSTGSCPAELVGVRSGAGLGETARRFGHTDL